MKPAYVILAGDDISATETAAELFAGAGKMSVNTQWVHEADLYVEHITADPREALEALPEKLVKHELELARIIAVVDAAEVEKRGELKPWLEMMAHFADVMLLKNTRQASPAWLGALKKSWKDRPMMVVDWPEALKKNADAQKAAIAYPEARRLSQYFDADAQMEVPVFESEEEDPEQAREMEEDGEEIPQERYFERDAAGRYKVKVAAP